MAVVDFVFPHSRGSTCFTKGYTQYLEGTGSMLCYGGVTDKADVKKLVEAAAGGGEAADGAADRLEALRVRYFSPDEVRQLLCFPEGFRFHGAATTRQQYRLLGNSVSVGVVTEILAHLLARPL
ncbi:DNA (cytosine-5)-methyltransferase [Diplonema papillatum]|nr:DNA (cytosine-5)-methyltransferase [Diplonema papillatum]